MTERRKSVPEGPRNPWGIWMPENPETEAEKIQASLAKEDCWVTIDAIQQLLDHEEKKCP